MNLHPQIDSYFVWMREETEHKRRHDEVWMEGTDSIVVHGNEGRGIPTIFDKTVKAIEYILRVSREQGKSYDYVLRSNLSSFFIWDRLIGCLETMPRTTFVMGRINTMDNSLSYPSGCGFLMSVDVARVCVEERESRASKHDMVMADDCMFGYIFAKRGIAITNHPYVEFEGELSSCALQLFHKTFIHKHLGNQDAFHIRVRHGREWYRNTIEPLTYARLVNYFYANVL